MRFSSDSISNCPCNKLSINSLWVRVYLLLRDIQFFVRIGELILAARGGNFSLLRCYTDDRRLPHLGFCETRTRRRKCQFAAAAGRVAVVGEVLADKVAKITRRRFGVAEIKL